MLCLWFAVLSFVWPHLVAAVAGHRAAIVTTFRVDPGMEANWPGVIEYWLHWHVDLLGFTRIYIYADSEDTLPFLFGLRQTLRDSGKTNLADALEVVDYGRTLRDGDQWDLHAFIERQIQNCHDAYRRAREQTPRIHWLMHMDVDELFYIPPDTELHKPSFAAHLAWLKDNKVGTANYLNYEGIPEHAGPMDNYFTQVTHFKVHAGQFGLSSSTVWTDPTSPIKQLGFGPPSPQRSPNTREYFVAYANGKSIVRVLPYGAEWPQSQNHVWTLPAWMINQVRSGLPRKF
eukprot:c2069_g1_i2.p1 GENE.c2069_g1_i2~~c2069_g1_i2.p1  ORF type:complete len:288 (+),score=47.25 c2069_g1_i2:25-888(+)